MNGILIINKEKGYTSHDVVAKLRGILHIKKIGHTGTLDPDATGVLPVCIGNATKLCDLLMDRTKVYTAGVKLGITTDTQDISGTVISEAPANVTEDQLLNAVTRFLGEIDQLTPMYSARKVNGQKLVDLARQGKTVERPVKRVRIDSITVTDFNPEEGTFTMQVTCSKGTYIRTLCNDIGEALGCGACMTSLRRDASGEFTLTDAVTLTEAEQYRDSGRLDEVIKPTDSVFTEYSRADITEEGRKYLTNGNPLSKEHLILPENPTETVRVYMDNTFFALYERKGPVYSPVKMFFES
ncbi:MAG: tRNA pseudouridine(55) synthase TruB [Lachnospiraceae bacterium]|nr:tRNA pseudouridine(55) synthase TruB [Lachnospiraceae bacterium]